MIPSAVTVSLVTQARGGPFVFWDDLSAAAEKAAALGFDAIEIFAPSPDAVNAVVDKAGLIQDLDKPKLKVLEPSAGTGNIAQAAATLGISRQLLYYKMKKYKMQRMDYLPEV